MSLVLDNSVSLAWCFENEQTAAKMALLDRVAEEGAVVPQLWPLEALNVLLIAERRGRIDSTRRQRLVGFLRDLPISVDEDTTRQAWVGIADLAQAHGLTMYDASYLELAVRLALPLATDDAALVAAAERAGVTLLRTA